MNGGLYSNDYYPQYPPPQPTPQNPTMVIQNTCPNQQAPAAAPSSGPIEINLNIKSKSNDFCDGDKGSSVVERIIEKECNCDKVDANDANDTEDTEDVDDDNQDFDQTENDTEDIDAEDDEDL